MDNYILNIPTKIYFGSDAIEKALEKEKEIIGKKTLVIMTGNTLKRLGFAKMLFQKLNEIIGEENVFCFDQVGPNPEIRDIEKAIELGKKDKVRSVIGFGGGSAIDAAKATAVGIPVETPIMDYLLKGIEPGEETLPIIAIPTTAGTGAELTKGAIVSCKEKKIKSGIRGENITPKIAIVNPELTYQIPKNVTFETGFDVLAHAMESYLAVNSNEFSEMLSKEAIRNVSCYLRRLAGNLEDWEARDKMSFSSMLMGFNVKNIGNCLPHRMQYPVGIVSDTSHGAGLIALYPAWLKYEYDENPEKVSEIFQLLGKGSVSSGEAAQKQMLSFLDELGIRKTLSDLGISQEQCTGLSGMVTGNLLNDKLGKNPEIVEKIYVESM